MKEKRINKDDEIKIIKERIKELEQSKTERKLAEEI